MAVYVDGLKKARKYKDGTTKRVGGRHNDMWCHLWADDVEELHEFAASIGMKRSWFQDDRRLPHYDLVPTRRYEAVLKGAKEVGMRELFEAIQRNRGNQCR